MKAKKGLQKFTSVEDKINKLLKLEVITKNDIEHFTTKEREQLGIVLAEKNKLLKGIERDNFHKKVEQLVDQSTKNQLWEYNHNQITCCIATLMQECGRMPTQTEIATKAGLSRQTIHKHLKEYLNHPLYLEQVDQFKFMTAKVLTKVFQYAVNGDTGAAKLYLNAMGYLNNGQGTNNTLIQNQNNYIQINGTVLSQETVKHLNPEQLNTIETILKTALIQPK